MTTFVTVRPPPTALQSDLPAERPPLRAPGRPILWIALLGIADTLYLTYVHLFLSGACLGDGGCKSVLDSEYSRALGIPLAAFGLGLFVALAVAASRRELGWVRLFAITGALPGPYLIFIQAARLEDWCPFCLVSTALLATAAILSLRGGRGDVDLGRVPQYLAAMATPIALAFAVEHGLKIRDARRALLAPAPQAAVPSATIAGERVTLDHVPEVGRLEWDIYRARLTYVEREVLRREAKALGTTVDDLVLRNIDGKVVVPEADILRRYKEEGGAGGAPSREQRMQVAARLVLERRPAVEAAYLQSLFEKHRVIADVQPPGARERIPLNPRDGPARGPADAKLEIVVFSDFSCPTCARVFEWLKTLDVPARVAYRQLPLGPPNPSDFAAAAAHEQGKFFEFAEVLFKHRADFDPARMEAYAAEAKLDLAMFRACLASDRPRAAVQADLAEARALGIQVAPTLFLNGVHFVGVPDARLVRAVLDRDGR